MWEILNAVDQLVVQAAALTAMPVVQVKYLFALLSIYPLALVFRMLPATSASSWAATAKHLFSVVISIGLCSFALGPYTWVHTIITTTICYLLLRFLPHNYSHQAVFVVRWDVSCLHSFLRRLTHVDDSFAWPICRLGKSICCHYNQMEVINFNSSSPSS